MAVILAIDASIGRCSAAVWREGKAVAYRELLETTKQSSQLLPLIEATLQDAKLDYKDLNLVACTIGPGSFTGIRIGIATARGIAFAANIPSLGFTTLEVMAHATGASHTLAIVNAGKGEVYYQAFGNSPCEPSIGKLDDVLKLYPNHSLACSVPLPAGYATPAITHPRADALAELAATQAQHAVPLAPFYIRPPDAKPQSALFTDR